jgi:hypothetical protein
MGQSRKRSLLLFGDQGECSQSFVNMAMIRKCYRSKFILCLHGATGRMVVRPDQIASG